LKYGITLFNLEKRHIQLKIENTEKTILLSKKSAFNVIKLFPLGSIPHQNVGR
jgi:hypothetical protein